MRQHTINFANFICTFGEGDNKKVLMDYIDTIVLPAFVDDSLVRSIGTTHLFFYETKLEIFDRDKDEPTLALTGRFIKNTMLKRDQIFDPNKGLISDQAGMESAPSAFFILLLNNHRLIYFPETPYAPDFRSFKATTLHRLKTKHFQYIQSLLEDENNELSEKELKKLHPIPNLSLIPVSDENDLSKYLEQYSTLEKIEFDIVKSNDEIDASDLFHGLRETAEGISSENAKFVVSNKEGLDIEEAKKVVDAATSTANQDVKLIGKSESGDKLIGTNHDFSISVDVDPIPVGRRNLTEKMISVFRSLVSNSSIGLGIRSNASVDRIKDFARQIPED